MEKRYSVKLIDMLQGAMNKLFGKEFSVLFVDNRINGQFFFLQNRTDNEEFYPVPIERILNIITEIRQQKTMAIDILNAV